MMQLCSDDATAWTSCPSGQLLISSLTDVVTQNTRLKCEIWLNNCSLLLLFIHENIVMTFHIQVEMCIKSSRKGVTICGCS